MISPFGGSFDSAPLGHVSLSRWVNRAARGAALLLVVIIAIWLSRAFGHWARTWQRITRSAHCWGCLAR